MAPAVQWLAGAGAAQERLLLPTISWGTFRTSSANGKTSSGKLESIVADPHYIDPDPAYHFDADADPDPARHLDAEPDPTFHFDAVPDPDPTFQIRYRLKTLKKVLK